MKSIYFLFITILSSKFICFSQYSTENGYYIPVKTNDINHPPIRVLFAFGENGSNSASACWPAGQLPVDASNMIDNLIPGSGYITKYYQDASFGQFTVLGDYVNQVLQINNHVDYNSAFAQMNSLYAGNGNVLPTAKGSILSSTQNDFDNYNITYNNRGFDKQFVKDNVIDVFILLFRSGAGGSGFGCNGNLGKSLGPYNTDVYAAFQTTGDKEDFNFILQEFFHCMFGGNNWHLGREAGQHTFAFETNGWGLCSQYNTMVMSNVVSGWDRNHLGWKAPGNTFLISAREDLTNLELNGKLDISQFGAGSHSATYVLRDFVTQGDALQIKLPHINFQTSGNKKNQYLWIENHQMINQYDHDCNYIKANLNCNNTTCGSDWNPGLLGQIQVGKDQKDQLNWPYDIFDGAAPFSTPNAQNSWMFPLTADGSYDFVFGPGLISFNPCSL